MGIKPFTSKFPIRMLAQGQASFRWLLVRKGSGIAQPADLVGKTIAANRKPLPEVALVADAVFSEFGIAKDQLRIVSTADLDAENRGLRTGTIDGAFMPFSLSQPVTVKLFADGIVAPLILDQQQFAAVKARLPDIFFTQQIKANHFQNQPDAFPVLAMKILLASSADLPDETVYKVTKAIMGNHDEFAKIHGSARAWTVKNTLDEPKIPFHPGAIRYYQEIGVWNADMDAVQKRLLSSVSD
jgi:TRAP transporter TAXI family solute receptor